MEKNDYGVFTIDFSDLFAFLVKKVFIIIMVCVLSTLIGVGLHLYFAGSDKSLEKYDFELKEFNDVLNLANSKLKATNSSRLAMIESRKEDPIFDLYDADNVFESTVSFFIDTNEEAVVSDSGSLIYPGLERLSAFFSSVNLKEIVGSDFKNEYLKRLILLSAKNNHITITVYHQSADMALSWAERVYDALYGFSSDGQSWKISGKTVYTELYLGQYIIDYVSKYDNELAEIEKSIIEQTKSLKELEAKRPSRYHFLKYAVIGFVLGGFLCVQFIILNYIKRNPVANSFYAEKKTRRPFIGALFPKSFLLDKLARAIIGERKYFSESEAIDYIKGNIRNTSLKEDSVKNVAILCSCKSKDVEKKVKTIESILSEFGCKATLVTDVSVNPESADVVSSTDAVILLERQWVSQWKLVGVSMDLAERFDKPVVGFVLC